jgi:hypothetical protein
VGKRRFGEREGLADERADLPGEDVGEDLAGEVGALARPDLEVPDAGDRDVPPAGVVAVDGGEGSAGRAVGGEPAAVGDDSVGVAAELAADAVEHNDGTSPFGGVQDLRCPARLAVVDDGVGPGLGYRAHLGLASCRADDPRTAGSQELDEEDAHAAGGPEDQDLFPGMDVGDPGDAKGRRPVVNYRRGVERAKAIGHRDGVVEGDDGLLGVTARAAGVGNHRPPHPVAADAVADGRHLPGYPAPRDIRRTDREEARPASRPDHGVNEHHVACGDGDDEFAGTGDWVGGLNGEEHVRPAEAGHFDDEHGLRPRAAGRRRLRCRASAGRDCRDRR